MGSSDSSAVWGVPRLITLRTGEGVVVLPRAETPQQTPHTPAVAVRDFNICLGLSGLI
jgi:hypothetical protein